MHFAAVVPPFLSHVRCLDALAAALIRSGHRVTFLHQPDAERLVRQGGFAPVGADTHPPGTLARIVDRSTRATTLPGILRLVSDMAAWTDMLCRQLPGALEKIAPDAVLVDEMEPAGGLVAEALGLPFVSVANAATVRRAPAVPLPVLDWHHDDTPRGHAANAFGARVYDIMTLGHQRVILQHARRLGLPDRRRLDECVSPTLGLSQLTTAIDLPRPPDPTFVGVGPLRLPADADGPLDIDLPPGRPVVFASLGTFHGWRVDLFRRIAQACRALGVTLVVAHCGRLTPAEAASIDAHVVTDFLPQRAMLERADVVVSHAGLNTVLDALVAGRPILAIPLSFDQPGMGARLVHHRAGLVLKRRAATVAAIKAGLARVLSEPEWTARSAAIGREIAAAGGADRGAALIEETLAR